MRVGKSLSEELKYVTLFVPYCRDFMFSKKILDYFVSEARSEISFLQPASFILTRYEIYLGIVCL